MAARRTRQMVERLWRIVQVLQGKRRGMTVRQLVQEVGASRATMYRALKMLEECGVPLATETVNGEVRYLLDRTELPALRPSAEQWIALQLARDFLAPLDGTTMVKALDDLIDVQRAAGRVDAREGKGLHGRGDTAGRERRVVSRASGGPLHHPAILEAVERGVRHRRRLRLLYRGAGQPEAAWRVVDGAALRVVDEHTYLIAWDLLREAWRTFKVARIQAAQDSDEPTAEHPGFDEERLFRHAVKIWSTDDAPAEVVVRILSGVAFMVVEWPLHPEQELEHDEDGSVTVRATVAGIEEAKRWVLRWGQNAQVLAPPALRAEVARELRGALSHYARESGPELVSSKLRQPDATVRAAARKTSSAER